jgi:hypothetical protein
MQNDTPTQPVSPIDLESDALLTLAQAAGLKLWPRRRAGKRPHVATLYRWSSTGCRGVRLAVVIVGSSKCTTEAACRQFILDVSRARQGQYVPAPELPHVVNRRVERATYRLRAEGV